MNVLSVKSRSSLFVLLLISVWIITCVLFMESKGDAFTLALVGTTLILWLSEITPAFVPTLLLISGSIAIPMSSVQGDSASFLFKRMADPILGLFFCGMCLGLMLRKHGIDHMIAAISHRLSRGSLQNNLRFSMLITACLAMWTTNSTAMAMCLPAFGGTIQMLWKKHPKQAKGYLIGLAMAANFGGMATPIGTAPNAIAIAAIEGILPISFGSWMILMFPLACLLILLSEILVSRIFTIGSVSVESLNETSIGKVPFQFGALILFGFTLILWLTESWHGIHPLAIGFGAAALGFFTRILQVEDLKDINWDVLLLIAGGLLLGFLLEDRGWMKKAVVALQQRGWTSEVQLGVLIGLAVIGSAISSNTATAVLLVPLALQIVPDAYSAIAVAAACSLGTAFTISTPANSMIAGRFGVSNRDLMKVGLPLMLFGGLLLYWTVEIVVETMLHPPG